MNESRLELTASCEVGVSEPELWLIRRAVVMLECRSELQELPERAGAGGCGRSEEAALWELLEQRSRRSESGAEAGFRARLLMRECCRSVCERAVQLWVSWPGVLEPGAGAESTGFGGCWCEVWQLQPCRNICTFFLLLL